MYAYVHSGWSDIDVAHCDTCNLLTSASIDWLLHACTLLRIQTEVYELRVPMHATSATCVRYVHMHCDADSAMTCIPLLIATADRFCGGWQLRRFTPYQVIRWKPCILRRHMGHSGGFLCVSHS